MDWEKYTGKKSAAREIPGTLLVGDLSGPTTFTVTDPGKRLEYVDDHTVRIVYEREIEKAIIGIPPIDNTPEPLPSFDEIWETVQSKLENRAYDGLPMQQAIVAMVKDAARAMYETLTQEQNDE